MARPARASSLTSADIAFGWQVAADPAAPLGGVRSIARFVEAVDTPDSVTAVLRWRQPSQFGGELTRGQLDPLPKHILETTFVEDKENLVNHPLFHAR